MRRRSASRTRRSPGSTTRSAVPSCKRGSKHCTSPCVATPRRRPRMRSRRFLRAEQLGLVFDTPPGLVAGVDEAGRGPLAGPVVAAAVILDVSKPIRGLKDSKVLTPLKRERLFDEIHAKALCFSIAQASVQEIDALNILQATLLAMKRA